MAKLSLDNLYQMTAHIYSEQNFHRPVSATFLHFVEVCGMLTVLVRKKKRESFSFEDSLCKTLGWFFPLMVKCGVVSLEALVFRKFPLVCPYCRKSPHDDSVCKTVRGTDYSVDHAALRGKVQENLARIPIGLNDWQRMFQTIYPRTVETNRSVVGLMEELGELAEALRVFERHPRFLAGEAADTFSYIMGVANEYSIALQMEGKPAFDFEREYLRRYPGLCLACGNSICTCPSVPPATIGRMAKELEIDPSENLFASHLDTAHGAQVASEVLADVGGLESVVYELPLDKGQISNSIIVLCHRLADAIAVDAPELSNKLKESAALLTKNQTAAGEKHSPTPPNHVIESLTEAFRVAVIQNNNLEQQLPQGLGLRLIKAASTFKVLLVGVSAHDDERVNVEKESRAIKAAITRSKLRELIDVTELVGATVNDLRRALLSGNFDLIHFFGHGFDGGVVLSNSESVSKEVTIDALRELVRSHPKIKAVIFNSCDSLKDVTEAVGPLTIGMDDVVDDEVAISFAVGFYDAFCVGESVERAIKEGQHNVKMQHHDTDIPLKVLEARK